MNRLELALEAAAASIVAAGQASAALCEQAAERGVFLAQGPKCAWCLHSTPSGCRLRALAIAAE